MSVESRAESRYDAVLVRYLTQQHPAAQQATAQDQDLYSYILPHRLDRWPKVHGHAACRTSSQSAKSGSLKCANWALYGHCQDGLAEVDVLRIMHKPSAASKVAGLFIAQPSHMSALYWHMRCGGVYAALVSHLQTHHDLLDISTIRSAAQLRSVQSVLRMVPRQTLILSHLFAELAVGLVSAVTARQASHHWSLSTGHHAGLNASRSIGKVRTQRFL